jgi:hypothetical protein
LVHGNSCCLSLSVFEAEQQRKYIKARNAVRNFSLDSSDGYCLGDAEFNYRQEQEIFLFSKKPDRLSHHFSGYRGFCLKHPGVILTTHLHLVSRLRVCGAEHYSAPAIRLHDVVRDNLTVYFYHVAGNGEGLLLRQGVDAGLSISPHDCL